MASKLTAGHNGDGQDAQSFFEIAPRHEPIAESNDGAAEFSAIKQSQMNSAGGTTEVTDPFLPESDRQIAPAKSFAAILDGLRTDEDRFYFLVEGGRQSGMRVPIEGEEMPLGWHVNGEHLTFDVSVISSLLAIVRKDWSGVMLQPTAEGLAVNDEIIAGGRRLRDGDRVTLSAKERRVAHADELRLVFHEPASLVILDSLMPRSLPQDFDPSLVVQGNGHIHTDGQVHSPAGRIAALFKSDKEYFGAFTLVELSLMAIGTVVGAVIIFLILNDS